MRLLQLNKFHFPKVLTTCFYSRSFRKIKACVRYFVSNFYLSPNDRYFSPFKNYEKCFSFHLESSFRSRDIQVFLFPSSPLFLPVNHGFRGCSKISFKVYDVINYLNKNLITHFVWYLEKEKGMALKLRPMIVYQIRNTFMEKSCRKCAPKASLRPLFNFGK